MTLEQADLIINLIKGVILIQSVGLGLKVVSLFARGWNKVG